MTYRGNQIEKMMVRCPNCNSKCVVKRGKRKGKFGSKQRYYCKECKIWFVERGLRYKIYPPWIIYNALNYYNLGQNLRDVSRQVNKAFRVKTSKSTIHSWLHEFQNLCPISTVRENFVGYENVLFTKSFEHENLDYEFMYHKYKLDVLINEGFKNISQ